MRATDFVVDRASDRIPGHGHGHEYDHPFVADARFRLQDSFHRGMLAVRSALGAKIKHLWVDLPAFTAWARRRRRRRSRSGDVSHDIAGIGSAVADAVDSGVTNTSARPPSSSSSSSQSSDDSGSSTRSDAAGISDDQNRTPISSTRFARPAARSQSLGLAILRGGARGEGAMENAVVQTIERVTELTSTRVKIDALSAAQYGYTVAGGIGVRAYGAESTATGDSGATVPDSALYEPELFHVSVRRPSK